MSKIALSGNASGTGTFTLAAPNSNSDRTLNLPDNSGTVLTSASNLVGVTGVGKVLQVVSAITTSGSSSTTSATFVNSGFELSITPTSASSKVLAIFSFNLQAFIGSGAAEGAVTIFRSSTNILNSSGNLLYSNNSTNIHDCVTLSGVDSPNTTSSTTYSLRHRQAGAGNTSSINTSFGAVTITLMEIAA